MFLRERGCRVQYTMSHGCLGVGSSISIFLNISLCRKPTNSVVELEISIVFPAIVPLSDGPKSLIFYALVKPNRVKKRLRRSASGGAPPAGPPHQPGGADGRGCAATARLRRATSVLIGSSLLAADAASILFTGAARQYPTLYYLQVGTFTTGYILGTCMYDIIFIMKIEYDAELSESREHEIDITILLWSTHVTNINGTPRGGMTRIPSWQPSSIVL